MKLKAIDGDKTLTVTYKNKVATFTIESRGNAQSVCVSSTSLGFMVGSMIEAIDPDNVLGFRES